MDQSEKYPRPSETPEPQPENGQVDKEEPEPALKLSKPRFLLVLLGLVVSIFLASLDFTIISTAIPEITNDFDSLEDIGWYGSAFFITIASTQSLWGKIYTFFPLKWMYLTSISIFEIGSLICGVAPSSTVLIVGRAITGIGAAGLFAGSYTIIAVLLPPQSRPKYSGLLGAAYGVASVIGPLLGGAFTSSSLTWRWCFYINLPVGAFSAAVILIFFVAQPPPERRPAWRKMIVEFDLGGMVLVVGATVCFSLAMQWGGIAKEWKDPDVVGTLVGFGLLVIVFIVLEWYQGETAMLVERVIKRRTVAVASLFSFLINAAFLMTFYYLPIYFQSVQGVSAAASGIRTLPYIIAVTLCVIIAGQVISATGHAVPFMVGGAMLTAIGGGLIYTFDIGSPAGDWIGYQILAGIGVGISFQVPIMLIQSTTKEQEVPLATAILLFIQTLGGAFGVSGAQAAFQNTLFKALPASAPTVDPLEILSIGATEIQEILEPDVLDGVQEAYVDGFRQAIVCAIAMAGAAFLAAWGFRLHTIRTTRAIEGQD